MKALIVAVAFTLSACGPMTQEEADAIADAIRKASDNFAQSAKKPVNCYGYQSQNQFSATCY